MVYFNIGNDDQNRFVSDMIYNVVLNEKLNIRNRFLTYVQSSVLKRVRELYIL